MKLDLKDAVITLSDGSGTPKTLDINVGEGTLTFSEKRNIEYVKNRGLLAGAKEGDQEPVDLRIDIVWESLKGYGSAVSPYEALKKIGAATSWVSSDTDVCNPYAVDITVVVTPGCGSLTAETILFADFRYESIDGDFKAGTLTVSGKCNIIAPTVSHAS